MFLEHTRQVPRIRTIESLEPGTKLGAEIYAKHGELVFPEGTHLTGEQIDQLQALRWDEVIVIEDERHQVFDSPGTDEEIIVPGLVDGIRAFLENRDTRNLLESFVELLDLLRVLENLPDQQIRPYIQEARDFEKVHQELRQQLLSRSDQQSESHKDTLMEIISGEAPNLTRVEDNPDQFDRALVDLWQKREQLYDKTVELFQSIRSPLERIHKQLPGRSDLETPSETGRKYLLGLRRTKPSDLNTAPPLSNINEVWIDEVLEPPAFDEGDWKLSFITARVKQLLENLLVRGVFMRNASRDLFRLIEEDVATGEALYRRLTFPHQDENYMLSHIVNVLIISLFLGREAELPGEHREELGIAGLFFDLGMLRLDPELWTRGFKPDAEEVDQIQKHPLHSAEWLQKIFYPFSQSTLNIIRQHHERLDKSGYPQGLEAEELSFKTRILIVADVYDAMSTSRPHRSAIHPDKIITYLKNRTNKFDPEVVDLLENTIGPYPPGTVVQLETNEIGVSLGKGEDPYRPHIKLVIDSAGRVFDEPETIDLSEAPDRKISETIGSRNTPNALLKYMT